MANLGGQVDNMREMYHQQGRYQCKLCGRLFKIVGNLKQHELHIHHGVRFHHCLEPNCDKKFPTPEHLRKHIHNTHGNNRLKCTFCESVYGTSSALRRHERKHSDERRYTCEQCGVGFDLSEPYKIHLRNHDGIRPYKCSICRKSFVSRAVCKRHKQQHERKPEERKCSHIE